MKNLDDKAIGIGALTIIGVVYMLTTAFGGKIPTEVVTNITVGIAGLVTGKLLGK